MDYTHEQVLRDYFKHLDDPENPDLLDVVEAVDQFASDSPLEAWPLVKQLIDIAPSECALDYLVAGPVEELLLRHGELMAPIIAADAERDARVSDALGCALVGEPSEAVRTALGRWLVPSSGT